MHALHVALQEGFAHEEIIVSLDGAPVYHERDVSTRQQIGFAASFDAQIKSGPHEIEVMLPRRGVVRREQHIDVTADTWLGISLLPDGNFDVRVADTPFGYL
jgi:hypothetical protein